MLSLSPFVIQQAVWLFPLTTFSKRQSISNSIAMIQTKWLRLSSKSAFDKYNKWNSIENILMMLFLLNCLSIIDSKYWVNISHQTNCSTQSRPSKLLRIHLGPVTCDLESCTMRKMNELMMSLWPVYEGYIQVPSARQRLLLLLLSSHLPVPCGVLSSTPSPIERFVSSETS